MPEANVELWPLKTVIAKTGMSRSFIYRDMKAGKFPARVLVGSAARWPSTKVQGWINEQAAAQAGGYVGG